MRKRKKSYREDEKNRERLSLRGEQARELEKKARKDRAFAGEREAESRRGSFS